MASANLFLSDVSVQSSRHAVIEDDGEVAYLYLTERGRQNIVASAWIYSRTNFPDPTERDWTFLWSDDGESVAVLADGHPLACIVGAVGPGYSRELEAGSSLGHAWDDTTYARVFRRV
jgi:hypothetical protein